MGSGREQEVALMAAFLGKDPKAARQLYDRLASRIYGLGLMLLWNKTDAEDLVQDTFLKIWRIGSAYDPTRGPLDTWIMLCARGLAIDLLRRRSLEARKMATLPKVEEGIDQDDPERLAEVGDLFRRASDVMADLPQRQRSALEVTYLGQRSTREAAELLGIPRGTVKSRVSSGMAVLQRTFAGDDDAA